MTTSDYEKKLETTRDYKWLRETTSQTTTDYERLQKTTSWLQVTMRYYEWKNNDYERLQETTRDYEWKTIDYRDSERLRVEIYTLRENNHYYSTVYVIVLNKNK